MTASLRVVNYHLTPATHAATYDREFAALAARYAPVTEDTLAAYLTTRHWPHPRPGVIPVFYNGYRNNYDVALPLLNKHHLTGWFMAVPGFTDATDQPAFAAAHNLSITDEYTTRHALSWDELRHLDQTHVVASHTRTHSKPDAANLSDEIEGAQADFQQKLGHRVRSFAWLLGGRYGEHPAADAAVDRAGYEFLFSNLSVQRLKLR
ncbi:MAG: polysaccharide deacetylase family protein [Pseudorhodobacter sp.]|nr:polysaccharide deacetylase family protein [Pseudorhodobacter sp.]